jgi:sulfonate transport system permease protein
MSASALSVKHHRRISVLVFLGIAAIWQVLSIAYPVEAAPGEPMIPGWQVLFTRTFLSMADYWQGGLGVPSVAEGAERSYLAALLSLVAHSFDTLVRLICGLVGGWVVGLALGLAVSWSRWTRRLVDLPLQFIRTLPLLAMVPLFQLWFGTYFLGQVLFVAYGIGVIVFAGAVNAVRNVPHIFVDNARTLGASRFVVYKTIVLPAILPEMRSTMLLSLGTGWGAVLGAEYLGAQSGLGYIIVYAGQFAYLDRMFLIALLFIVYTSLSFWFVSRATARMLEWAPPSQRS